MTAPRVSAIMPTADRRRYVPQAIAAFLAQTGADDAELLILDDGDDPVADLVPDDPRIRYVRETPRRQIGDKRNRMCALARGEIIVHWDDDDWHLPYRIARQVAALETSGAQICGLDRILFLAEDGSEAWEYVWGGRERWVYGASLAYRRSYWQGRGFPQLAVGEDTRWVMQAPAAAVHAMAENDILVARVHPGNTSPKQTRGGYYHGRDPAPLRALIEQAGVRPAEPLSPPLTLRNVHAVLVHEKPECVIDLVRNLRHLDPDSPILLYDGSPGGTLLDTRLPWSAWGCEIVPNSRPMKWGTLHDFALDCIRHLGSRDHDVMTIVDSDQLMLRGGYGAWLARTLAGRDPRRMVLSPDPAHQGPATRIPPARTAQLERELWRPFLGRFEGGEAKFVHWTFWPATVIGADAGRAIAALFEDPELQAILSRSSLWATEEILFPTLAALLGYEVARNPCRSDFVQYRTPWRISDVDRALGSTDTFFIHPVPRVLDDRLRMRIRERHGGYRGPAAAASGPAPEGSLWPVIAAMREIDGWLSDEEGEALLLAARAALARPGAVGRIVEIGSHCGKATYLLAQAARGAREPAKVVAIDRFDGLVGSREGRLDRLGATRARFDDMVERHDLGGWIEVHQGEAADAAAAAHGPVDLLVVDGLHDYAAVAADFHAFADRLGPGSRVAFHDYADYFPGVCAFVDALVVAGAWRVETAVGTLRVLAPIEEAAVAGTAAPCAASAA